MPSSPTYPPTHPLPPPLQALHKMLFDVHVMEGALVCPETGRRFGVKGGVVDMMMTDEELS